MSEKQYAERDLLEMDRAGNHYSRHVMAMTAEQLHRKSDIAAELGWRDMQIAALQQKLDATERACRAYQRDEGEMQKKLDAMAENEGYKQAFYEMAEILGIGARPDSPKNVFEQVMKPMLANLKKESAELTELGLTFDELARAIGWSEAQCEQTGESPKDVAVSLVNLISELQDDAYLNSVRAEGVDYVADAIGAKCAQLKVGSKEWKALKNIVFTLVGFAAQLRAGEAK